MEAIDELVGVVARLRGPGGCPWDREQTHASLRPYAVEEAYEVVDAIARGDDGALREELGDLLLQVVLHGQIASEQGRFDFAAIARGVAEKMVRRHPHVFGDATAEDSAAVLGQWEKLKREEKGGVTAGGALEGVARSLPGLVRAADIQKKAARCGFDWAQAADVIAKVREELAEVEAELRRGDREALEAELGDLLFAATNLARKAGVDAELAIRGATEKFVARFSEMERRLAARGKRLEECDLAEMDEVWGEVKRGE
jgi:MazG family protein